MIPPDPAPARFAGKALRRIVLDPRGRTPLSARILDGASAHLTIIVVTKSAPSRRLAALRRRARVLWRPPGAAGSPCPGSSKSWAGKTSPASWSKAGGETNALWMPLCQRVVFFYAPLILGGRRAPTAVAGDGARTLAGKIRLRDVHWRRLGGDLLLIARVEQPK